MTLGWGHININVTDLDRSVAFYEKLGFRLFIPGIPYLGMTMERAAVSDDTAALLDLPSGTLARACILSLGDGFPKLDLCEFALPRAAIGPPLNSDLGPVRICLGSTNLEDDVAQLSDNGVAFISPPGSTHEGLADVAICRDPDGTLIELIQPHLEKWGRPTSNR